MMAKDQERELTLAVNKDLSCLLVEEQMARHYGLNVLQMYYHG